MISDTSHPGCDLGDIGRLLRDELPEAERSRAIEHLDRCEDCQRRIERLAAGSRWWHDVRSLDETGDDARDPWGSGEDLWLGFLDPPEKDGQIGRLGSYEVLEVIGRGGMGMVLKAHDPGLNRFVAIKVLAPHLSGTVAARRRFSREAKAAAAVSHEHVVAIHSVESGGRLPCLVMQYVAGKSLQQRIDQTGPLDTADIVRIGMQAAAGLAAAHAQGLIHRDVKPSNILLENGVERVKLTDFGLALAIDDASLTQSGLVAGTPQYMAPEQARGEPVDHRADLFSLGSVLYAMACGRPPFRASSTVAVLRRVSDEAPRPVREVNPDVPEWLAAIIARLHARDTADRFQSAVEVADLLGRWLAHLHSPHTVPRPQAPPDRKIGQPSPQRHALAAGLIGLACVIGLGGASGIAQQVVDRLAIVLRIKTDDGFLVIEADDPDVKVRVDDQEVILTGAGLQEIRVRPGVHAVKAEKDGKPVYEEILSVQRGDRPVVRIGRERPGVDHRSKALPHDWDRAVKGPETGKKAPAYAKTAPQTGKKAPAYAKTAPETEGKAAPAPRPVEMSPPAGAGRRTDGPAVEMSPPAGAMPQPGARAAEMPPPAGESRRVQPVPFEVQPAAPFSGVSRAVSSLVARLRQNPGRSVALERERFGLFMIDLERGDLTNVADEPARGLYYLGSPSWSSDGLRLIFDASPGAIFHLSRIQMITPDGQRDVGAGCCPSFSPDGKRIAFLLNPGALEGATEGIWVMRADGSDRRCLGGYGRPKWSPDGRAIMVCDFSNPCGVSLLDASGTLRTIEGLGAYSVPDWAGKDTIVAAVDSGGEGIAADTIAFIDVSRPEWPRWKARLWRKGDGLDLSPKYPVYSPGSGRLVFVGTGPEGMALYVLERGAAVPRRLEAGPLDKTIQDVAISPDGRYVLFTSDRHAQPPVAPPPGDPAGRPPTTGVRGEFPR